MAVSLGRQAAELLRHARDVIAQSAVPDLVRQVDLRTPGSGAGWQALPPLSAAMAITARLAARHDVRAVVFVRSVRQWWTALARLAPDLAGTDLVVAELLVSAHTGQWTEPTAGDGL